MRSRLLTLLTLIATLALHVGFVPVEALPSGPPALVRIMLGGEADLVAVEASGIPVFARLEGQVGSYLLAGAGPLAVRQLITSGVELELLDPDLSGGAYYLAYPPPGRPTPVWERYGRLLLDDGIRLILETTPQGAEQLSVAGAMVQALSLSPKPLRPVARPLAVPTSVEPDPLVQTILDQVSASTVYSYTGNLSGEWPVAVGGAPYTIVTRHTSSGTPIQRATEFVGEHLQALGLDVEQHVWSGPTNPNVIGELPGQVNPDDIYIISAHLDDMPSGPLAPGADDNASGSVAVLLAADLFTQLNWGCTLRFAFWTGEEQGLLGSEAYAQRAYANGENIQGVLNLDMIAWDMLGGPDIDLYAKPSMPDTVALAQLFADVVNAYGLDLIPQVIANGMGASDHASFWDYGYTAILGIEDYSGGDFNDYYHTVNDRLEYLNLPYYAEFVKAALATFAHMSGCLLSDGIGFLDGQVSAAQGGAPVVDATITAAGTRGYTLSASTDLTGYYSRTLLADCYTVTATAYAYLPATITDVVILTDTVTTQDFVLQTAPTYTLSGTVAAVGSGAPLAAELEFLDTPVTVHSSPVTGFYQAALPQGGYTVRVSADRHRPLEQVITVDDDQTLNFFLEPLPCILLVDDDNNAPDVRPYYAAALDDLGRDYDVLDVGGGSASGPTAAQLTGYAMVIWFSGDKYGSDSAGPNAADEASLATYLDGGGRLFLSSQDYLWDMGLTSFAQSYLGVSSFTNDSGNASTKYGLAGDPIGDGLGPYPLSYPAGFSDYGDVVNAAAGASVAFRSGQVAGNNLDLDKDGGDWRTVFFGTSWVPIYAASAINGRQVLQRIIDWFGGCEPPAGWLVGTVTDAETGTVLAGTDVSAQAPSSPIVRTTTNASGQYTMTLPPGTYRVAAARTGFVSQTITDVVVLTELTTTQNLALEPRPIVGVEPLALGARLFPDQAVTQTLRVGNTGAGDLLFTLQEMSVTLPLDSPPGQQVAGIGYDLPWLSANPLSGTVAPGEALAVSVSVDSTGIQPGDYLGALEMECNDPDQPALLVPVTLTVECPLIPTAWFSFTVRDLTADFWNGSQNAITYQWDLGDGAWTSEVSPTHTYSQAGTFTVTLTASSSCASDSFMRPVTTWQRVYLPLCLRR